MQTATPKPHEFVMPVVREVIPVRHDEAEPPDAGPAQRRARPAARD
jgi:hypothetical protein